MCETIELRFFEEVLSTKKERSSKDSQAQKSCDRVDRFFASCKFDCSKESHRFE